MAGGGGTRFWPLSRQARPKQLLPILGETSMLHQTVERLLPLFPAERVYVITGRAHADDARDDLEMLPPENVIDEPAGRDTAPCVGLAAAFLEWRDPGATFCALPADHFIGDRDKFLAALRAAFEEAQSGALVTFGVKPRHAATGYGYLECEGKRVRRFCEKPDAATARKFVESGRHFWNSGIFVWRAAAILEEFRRHLPGHHAILSTIAEAFGTSRLPETLALEFPKMPRISIDYGVMEKAADVVMIETDFDWDDVGSWRAAAARRPTPTEGLTECVDSPDCLVLSTDDHLVATLGVEGLVVVHTPDATLVARKDRSEELKRLVERLKARGLEKLL
ncbi:MAG: NTP transferase domain-containing protein [Planctomycetes bacterium]|nr:NTP transferase domain-containing protein [Planctomycetota bacterium]